MKRDNGTLLLLAILGVLLWLHVQGGVLPGPPSPSTKATAAVYVYEKDATAIPSAVFAAIDKLNRAGIVATTFDKDIVDGGRQVPDQYKAPLAAATQVGLPSLVVVAGEKVLKVVKNPSTESAILEAVK